MASDLSVRRSLLLGIAWLLIVAGGLLLLFGGGFIHAVRNTSRWFAEVEGDGLGAVFLVGGIYLERFVAKDISHTEEDEKRDSESPHK